MLHSYLGLASQHGLEIFCLEQPHAVQFLWRRARRAQGRVACFWTVMPAEAARFVEVALQVGCPREAMDLLEQHAHESGTLLPFDEESLPGPLGEISR